MLLPPQRINAVKFNADASVIISAAYDQKVKLWDNRSATRDPIQTLADFKDSVTSLSVTATAIVAGCGSCALPSSVLADVSSCSACGMMFKYFSRVLF